MRRPYAYDLDHGVAKLNARNEAWIDSKEPANQVAEYPPEQCNRCGAHLKHGGHDGHCCP
ncbi:hypothetical protein UFOVP842_34 [uncultured Caudovirales phage]|uniref:Uncharacterized protein n=1 Tax=uncultured Caudovirales phage TaxID=2100421 RepID=A0A6J5MYI1_9CAUD|nr:hypothetical protein UFOVP305_21 [uncultured Caudovirales phage]CAB4151598.1 hypothetical protein UFOVP593_24 [uncultured Caudovirales phage]CAB4166539.1 hypothetical protein UFOVP842_34 [uncultured Caudovirales phage]